jgi:hypothetical protein
MNSVILEKVRRKKAGLHRGETPARKLVRSPDGNRSRLFLSNEKNNFLAGCGKIDPQRVFLSVVHRG